MSIGRHLLLATIVVFAPCRSVHADYLEVRRSAILKAAPEKDAADVLRPEVGALLGLLESDQTDGYYHAQPLPSGGAGWIYRTLVRRYPGNPPATAVGAPAPAPKSTIRVASFNIKFLGSRKDRDNEALASVVKDEDIVLVQELVAPPFPGTFPNGDPFVPEDRSARFFQAMTSYGFSYVLSEEDTGKAEHNHDNGTATEWWVAFYKPATVAVAKDLPHGFLSEQRTANESFDRVPYAFGFRAANGSTDFVLISVHLRPSAGKENVARRRDELSTIAEWVTEHDDGPEKDFLIVGDMNIQSCKELDAAMPSAFTSLNAECVPTNTSVKGPRPFDHALYRAENTEAELDIDFGFHVIDLIATMRPLWKGPGPFPGDPYDGVPFESHYSDHNPVEFRFSNLGPDDD